MYMQVITDNSLASYLYVKLEQIICQVLLDEISDGEPIQYLVTLEQVEIAFLKGIVQH